MRIESSVTSLSWIPQGAAEGFPRLPFGLGVAHYDPPPPEVLGDLDELQAHDRFRFANRLEGWIEVQDGRVVDAGQSGGGRINVTKVGFGSASIAFTPVALPDLRPEPEIGPTWARFAQTTGGRTGFPAPRRVRHEPYFQIAAPVAWSTLALTVHADGTFELRVVGASSFPRHWIYDHTGRLVAKTGFIDYDAWWREAFGAHTPWGAEDSTPIVTAVESALEHQLSVAVIDAKPRFRRLQAGRTLVRQGERGEELFLLFDGVLRVEVDGEPVTEVGPGAIVGEMALLHEGRRTATLRAVTPCRVAVVPKDRIDRQALEEVAAVRVVEHPTGERVAQQAVPPQTRYAPVGADRLAYQVVGQGPPDLVFSLGAFSHVDIVWEDPEIALFLRRLASFCRLIRFDRRGTGASDPLPPDPLPPWEAYAEELTAVMDAAGSQRATLLAAGPQAGPMALFLAGTKPERITGLILADATARYLAADDYPIGFPPEAAEAMIARAEELWGTEAFVGINTPGRVDDERFRRRSARLQRAIASPRMVRTHLRALLEVDVRPLLPLIQAPTLVLHHRDFRSLPVAHGRYLAEHIPKARLVELPGEGPLLWDQPDRVLNVVEEFLIGAGRNVAPTRVLATVLFTDIVGSTRRAAELGDRRWRELLEVHDELADRLVEQWGGRLVKTTGDGILAVFDGPGRGIGCAATLRDELGPIGVQIRAGLHIGEIELRGDDVGGIAVHIAARVMATAGAGEIVVSRTVRDLVVGSDVVLQDRGSQQLKGVEGDWQLFAVVGR